MKPASLARIGNIEVMQILECVMKFSAKDWYPRFDSEALRPHEHWLCPDHFDPVACQISMPMQSFVMRIGKYNVLIDTCIGNHKPRPGSGMNMLNTPYLDRLKAVGLGPEDIDMVMCTHLHIDHIGWNTCLENGRWVPTFPNAKYIFSRVEYEAAKAEAERPETSQTLRNCFEDSVYPIVQAGRAVLVEGTESFFDVLTLKQAPGHSPQHLAIELRSQDQIGVFAGDIMHSPIQVPMWTWSSRVCWDQEMSAQSRRKLLEFCAETNALLIPGHFCAPHVGRIRRDGDTFAVSLGQ